MSRYTYTISVEKSNMTQCDTAIELYLYNYPDASVDDALNALFELGVNAMISVCEPENSIVSNEVCL